MHAPARLNRRDCLRLGLRLGAAGAFALWGRPLAAVAAAPGELGEPDENGLRLPPGFRSRIVARSGEPPVAGGTWAWHAAPDGGATFPTRAGGWIYVSNSELRGARGGVGALRFDRQGTVVDAYPILTGTTLNCAGGPTPWGTWLSGEEYPGGRVWECDPEGAQAAVVRPALGVYTHEAVAVDPERGQLYLTEDVRDGCWYRYTPNRRDRRGRPDLDDGVLEAAAVAADGRVAWLRVPDPLAATLDTRRQVPDATRFDGGEGTWYAHGHVYFTTKGDDRVWDYDLARQHLRILYERATSPTPVLSGVDNVTVAPNGDVLVCEDAGDMQIVAIAAGDGRAAPLVQVDGHRGSEVTGAAFDPSGTRLYFSSQRGARNDSAAGVTFEVTGPFGRRAT
jgi:secreted PhoX family phosphatase